MIQDTAITSKIQRLRLVSPTHARKMYILVKIPIKNRSPGVVGIGRKPRRSMEGDTVCHIVIATRIRKMEMTKIAVGSVHAIHDKVSFIVAPLD
jgi:hypothetical protein